MAAQAHLLVMYPVPKDPKAFDRAYREEHLPYAGPRLTGALGVASKRVAPTPGSPARYYAIWDVPSPSLEPLQEGGGAPRGKEAPQHAAPISSGGPPTL